MNERRKLKRVTLKGFKSISLQSQTIEFGDITILLGANGAGKSNLVSFFDMISHMIAGRFQTYIAKNGFADSLLHYGAKRTPYCEVKWIFTDGESEDEYALMLSHAAGDSLIVEKEMLPKNGLTIDNERIRVELDEQGAIIEKDFAAGRKESLLAGEALGGVMISGYVYSLLKSCQTFQFHDTSDAAKIKGQVYIEDNRYLHHDAGNLAAFLYALKNRKDGRPYYQRIIHRIRGIFPQFSEFDLKPSAANEKYILLNWREKGESYLFGPHQLSDGTLRFMALAVLLLQPKDSQPGIIVLDEPELGLHPAAISSLAGMVKIAAKNAQVILATQSPRLVDEFEAEDIVVVERDETTQNSVFKRLDEAVLSDWLERYCLSELWEKNVLGGKP